MYELTANDSITLKLFQFLFGEFNSSTIPLVRIIFLEMALHRSLLNTIPNLWQTNLTVFIIA